MQFQLMTRIYRMDIRSGVIQRRLQPDLGKVIKLKVLIDRQIWRVVFRRVEVVFAHLRSCYFFCLYTTEIDLAVITGKCLHLDQFLLHHLLPFVQLFQFLLWA